MQTEHRCRLKKKNNNKKNPENEIKNSHPEILHQTQPLNRANLWAAPFAIPPPEFHNFTSLQLANVVLGFPNFVYKEVKDLQSLKDIQQRERVATSRV